jgi:hypothetical protein
MRLDLLTSAIIVDYAIMFLFQKSKDNKGKDNEMNRKQEK